MPTLQTRIFTGNTAPDATAQLNASFEDGSWDLVRWEGYPVLWMTHREVIPGAMQQAFYELHVTAWVDPVGTGVAAEEGDAPVR